MRRKGQAAMEFLMTYGWAILAAVIVIGVLAAFGVFNPSTYVPNRCILSAPLGCNAGTASAANVILEIQNGAGGEVVISSIAVEGCATDTTGWTLADGDLSAPITITCTSALAQGKFQGKLTVTYTKEGSLVDLTSTGELVDEVE
jgi:hypothetical protein